MATAQENIMQVLEAEQEQQRSAYIQSIMDLADQVAAISPDMRVPEIEGGAIGNKAQPQRFTPEFSSLDREAQQDAAVLSIEKLRQKYGHPIADRAMAALKSQAPTPQQAFTKFHQREREAKRELGKGLAAAGIEVQHHSVKDYTHVIVTQLDLLQDGAIPSVSKVVNAAFPDDPKKATSIKNSQNGKRRKQAWGSPAVMNHPMEKAMQATHGRDCMNRRHSARTFGQSLSTNAALFKSSDRITKLEARVLLLEQQMQATKQREALADAGATSSRDKVLALSAQGKKTNEVAKLLHMPPNTVKSIIRRSKSR